jgi:membrane protein required for colicin V production
MDNMVFMGLNWADIAILGIIFLSTIISLARGFFREAFSLATWIVAFWLGFKFSDSVSDLLIKYISVPSVRLISAFALIFIITIIIGGLVNFLLSQLIIKSGLSGSDRALGVVFGLARGILLIAVMLLFMSLTSLKNESWWQHSIIIPQFDGLVNWLQTFLPTKLTQVAGLTNLIN